MNLDDKDDCNFSLEELEDKDIWILQKLNSAIEDVNKNMDKYEVGLACDRINSFIWEDFCDYYIEFSKPALYGDDENLKSNTKKVLLYVLINSLKILHPIMPFITEEIYSSIPNKEDEYLITAKWPEVHDLGANLEAVDTVESIKDLIKVIRNAKSIRNIEPSRKSELILVGSDSLATNIKNNEAIIGSLIKISEIKIEGRELDASKYLKVSIPELDAYLPLSELIDYEKEVVSLKAKIKNYTEEIERLDKKLSNEGFVKNAPETVVNNEREKLSNYKSLLDSAKTSLKDIESAK